ncbi:MAG: AraC family transcriptional regulator, partial [Desulfobacteraceae bacterium]|nr:AraC family transcriptional regulator [Desulfobacteraceae bacterium]
VTGFSIDTSLEDDKVATDIPNFMRYFFANQLFQKIPDIIHPEKIYGIYSNLDVYNNFKFTIAYETQHLEKTPDGLDMHIIPPRNYAVFEAHGPMPEKLVNTWHYIYGNWLPNSIYERESGIDFEVYEQSSLIGENAKVDIYIPLKIVKE